MICGTKKWTFWLTLFLVEPSQLFIGRRLSNYHGHIVPEHLPTRQVRATSLSQAGSPGNNPRKLISSLSRYIIQRPPVFLQWVHPDSLLKIVFQGFLEEIKALFFFRISEMPRVTYEQREEKPQVVESEGFSPANTSSRLASPLRAGGKPGAHGLLGKPFSFIESQFAAWRNINKRRDFS